MSNKSRVMLRPKLTYTPLCALQIIPAAAQSISDAARKKSLVLLVEHSPVPAPSWERYMHELPQPQDS